MVRTLGLSVGIGIVFFLFGHIFPTAVLPTEKWIILLFFASLSFFMHQLMAVAMANNRDKFVEFFLAGVVVRLLTSVMFVGCFLYLGVKSIRGFIITFFALYLFYTFFEIFGLYRTLRRDSEK